MSSGPIGKLSRRICIPKKTCEYIESARLLHGDKYDYSSFEDTEYLGYHTKVEITCSCGHVFRQDLGRHAEGHGCPACQKNGFCCSKTGSLYFLKSKSYFKIGITNRDVKKRLSEINKTSTELFDIVESIDLDGNTCYTAEKTLLSFFTNTEKSCKELFSGYKESFISRDIDEHLLVFKGYTSLLDKETKIVSKRVSHRLKETPTQRRKRLSDKTGVPVGVVFRNNKWYFQLSYKDTKGVKTKQPLGAFYDKDVCISCLS